MTSQTPFPFYFKGILRCTLAITQRCNLACDYCYAKKKKSAMTLSTARKILNFIFQDAKPSDKVDIGFFGGEPLLEFDLLRKITELIETHRAIKSVETKLSVMTNGTILTDEIISYLIEKGISLCISCDGPPKINDRFRHYRNGKGASTILEKNIRHALKLMPLTAVNAVYSPETLQFLPETVNYFLSLGVRAIHLSPNISARWTKKEADMLQAIYDAIGQKYIESYSLKDSKYVNLIDSKIAVILQGGYKPIDRCKMGKGEYAFAPSGNVYPCERLIGSDDGKTHCLGNINGKLSFERVCKGIHSSPRNNECKECSLKNYCMNWCGCSNFHSTGRYDLVSPFTCASEKAAINAAYKVIQRMGNNWVPIAAHQIVAKS